jgi:hypothetical protein
VFKLFIAPATNDRGPRYMERVFAAIHQTHRLTAPLTLHFASVEGRVGMVLECFGDDEEVVCGPLTAHYPNCSLKTIPGIDEPPVGWDSWTTEVVLRPELFPTLRHAQFEDALTRSYADPITGILRTITPNESLLCRISIRIAPATERRCRRAGDAVRALDREFFRRHHRLGEFFAPRATQGWGMVPAAVLGIFARRTPHPIRTSLDTSTGRQHDREDDLQSAAAKIGGHLFETKIRLIVHTPPGNRRAATARIRQMAGALGALTEPRLATFRIGRVRKKEADFRYRTSHLSAHDELATLFHAPTATVAAEGMQTAEFRELEPPANFPAGTEEGSVTLGRVFFRDDRRSIGLDAEAMKRHVYCVGATGTGKSTLLLNLIQQTMQAGRGLTVIDVHGDLAEAALGLVPPNRTNDVIYFEAAGDSVVPFNPLACDDPARVDPVTSGVVSAFKKLFDSWGPRLESLLRFSVFVAVEQNGTLHDVLRLLTDKNYRESAVAKVSDEVVRSFWLNEFASWNGQYRTEAVSSVTNKLAPALANRRLRAITSGSTKGTLDLRAVMDRQQILIVNVSRGLLGQDHSTLLGSLLLTAVEQAALSRADRPEAERHPHTLFLDEFQSLLTPSTAIMLSEARKYGLGLVLSHQLTHQLDEVTYHAVVGNCGTMIALRVGLEDAVRLAPAFSKHAGQLTPEDLCNLPNHTAYVRALIAGHPSRPFSLQTLPPPVGDPDRTEIVRRTSARRNAVSVAPPGPNPVPFVSLPPSR